MRKYAFLANRIFEGKMVKRDDYLQKFINKKENGMIKVITGLRRSGKSYLLFEIYKKYLLKNGIDKSQIITLSLEDDKNIKYRNPLELGNYVRSKIKDSRKTHYVFLDEIQKVESIKNPYIESSSESITFVDTLLGLMKIKNVDLYVTGSNSKMLSSDILTEFRGRGDEIRIHPLSFREFYSAYKGEKHNAWREFFTCGGMPFIMSQKTFEEKSLYLKNLFSKIYLTDIVERNKLKNSQNVLDDLLKILSSSVGSLSNPAKIANTFLSEKKVKIDDETIGQYIKYFEDAFLLAHSERYDVKGRKYIGSPVKYYFEDIGLRNAMLNFRQTEENHIMENIIYNELIIRGYNVDVGVVGYNYKDKNGKSKRSNLEVDFVANKDSERLYIQSALTVGTEEKRQQEINSLKRIPEAFKKIVVVKDDIVPWYDENGIYYIGIEQFLLEKDIA